MLGCGKSCFWRVYSYLIELVTLVDVQIANSMLEVWLTLDRNCTPPL